MNFKSSLIGILLFISACSSPKKAVKIAVASNMEKALQEILIHFTKEDPSVKVDVIASSSGKLFAQIANGAPFDVFISADLEYPHKLIKEKKVQGKVIEYAQGTLIIWSKKNINLSAIDFLDSKYEKIAIANPETAPYGKAAVEYLKKTGVYEKIQSKLVFAESIGQVNHFIESQVVDFGFTTSSVVAGKKENWMEIDQKYYSPIRQGMCQLINAKNDKVSERLIKFMQSDNAKKILIKYGYKVN